MTVNEIHNTLLELFAAGVVVSLVMLVLFIVFCVLDFLRCYFHNIPFKSQLEELCQFYTNCFLPTMFLLGTTIMIFKFIWFRG